MIHIETGRREQLRILQANFLLQLLRDEWMSTKAVKGRLEQLQLNSLADSEMRLCCAAAELPMSWNKAAGSRRQSQELQQEFLQICRRTAAGWRQVYPFYDAWSGKQRMCFLILTKDGSDFRHSRAGEFVTELTHNVESGLRLEMTAAVGVETKGLKRLKNSYASCMNSYCHRQERGTTPEFEQKGMDQLRVLDELPVFPRDYERRLTLSLEHLDEAAFRMELDSLFALDHERAASSRESCLFLALRILLVFSGIAGKFESCGSSLQRYLWNSPLDISACTSSAQTQEQLYRLGQHVMNQVNLTRFSAGWSMIEAVRKYVENHYACELKPTPLAALFNMAESDLTGGFKQYVGLPVSEYITKLRMAQAEQHLQDNTFKNGEIALLAGYNDPDEFISCFKKYSGQTPKNYRECYLKKKR